MKSLKPIKTKKIKDLKNSFFVFDTETTKLSPKPENFVFGVIYGYNYKKVIYSVDDFIEEFQHDRYKKKTIFAHNAEFDLLTIFGNIYTEIDNSAVFNGKFITCNKYNVRFADSMNIFPTSVKKLGEILGIKKLDNEKVKDGKLTKKNITQEDIDYCIRDCEVVYLSLLKLFENVGDIKITIASISMYDFRKNYLVNEISYNEFTDEFFDSYYGGRTEAFKLGQTISKVYDINSLYPFCMTKVNFPDPRNLKKEVGVDYKYLEYLLMRYEGLAKITVRHKETYFGYLPYRDEKTNKLLFPVGTFTSCLNFNEIRCALKHKVIDIINVEYVVYSNPIESPFINFINSLYTHRLNSIDEFEKYLDKLRMNSLYGKFAQRMKFLTTYYNSIPYELIEELNSTEKYCELKMFATDREDCFLITENEKYKNSFFSIPLFSSYITSHARIILLENGLLPNEQNTVCYCDTDSVFLEGEFVGNVGKELGQFKLENKTVTDIKGLKNYSYIENGNEHRTIKGVHKSAEKINDNTYKVTQYYKTKEALRNRKESGEVKEVIKTITNKYDKREVLQNGETKPIKLCTKIENQLTNNKKTIYQSSNQFTTI